VLPHHKQESTYTSASVTRGRWLSRGLHQLLLRRPFGRRHPWWSSRITAIIAGLPFIITGIITVIAVATIPGTTTMAGIIGIEP